MSLAEREDMTINEAIMKSELGMTYSDAEHDQLIEWLKKLKHYQLGDCMNDCEHYDNCADYIYSKGYNKAVDCFVEELKKYTYGRTNGVYVEIPMYKVDELAEQLKME